MKELLELIRSTFGSLDIFSVFIAVLSLLVAILGILYNHATLKLQKKQQAKLEEEFQARVITSTVQRPPTITALATSREENERIQRQIRIFSQPKKSVGIAPVPVKDEHWQCTLTLESGLFVANKRSEVSFWASVFAAFFWGSNENSDFRSVQKPFGGFKASNEKNRSEYYIDTRETLSVSWHPQRKILATAGYCSLAKLWNIEEKELVTKEPLWSSYSLAQTLCWSCDGSYFVTDQHTFSGLSGEFKPRSRSGAWMDMNYSCDQARSNRGIAENGRGLSHLSSTHNFTPWKPGSDLLLVQSYSDLPNLVLMNAKTGELDRIIYCGVRASIKDTAWHPDGAIIAISYGEYGIRVVDVENNRIVDGFPESHLVGWRPDGKILVFRDVAYEERFVIWDGLDLERKPMPDEMKTEPWFTRLFRNTSADNNRYIRIEKGVGNIYSVESDKLLFTLPGNIASAAWSPLEGNLLATCSKNRTHVWELHV